MVLTFFSCKMLFKNSANLKPFLHLKHLWTKPEGYDTGIKVYNCVVKKKVPLIVKNKNLVTWYTCGPTVYDSSHIGHASCYVKLDIIQRILRDYFKLNLVTVMNITDVDDKIIKRSKEMNISVKELVAMYEKEFWDDLQALNVIRPNLVLHVTDNIDLIQHFIEVLIETKKAYVGHDNSVYFDVTSVKSYGKLQNIGNDNSTTEKETFKRSPQDFALWKASKPDEIYWESKWGRGRPGWHIECSALAGNVFGSSIDIHAGGIDLRFPHHENEEAQSCAYYSQPQWVNYWLHTGHLHASNDVKMSKSLKNTIQISKLLDEHSPDAFRMACLMTHYNNNVEFSDALMHTANNNLNIIKNFYSNCDAIVKGHLKADLSTGEGLGLLEHVSDEIHNALVDDFNTPVILKCLNNLISQVNKKLSNFTKINENDALINAVPVVLLKNYVKDTFRLLGISDQSSQNSQNKANDDFVDVVNVLIDFRQNIRSLGIETKNKDVLKHCDDVRDIVKKFGVVVKDYGKQSSWTKQ